MSVQILVLKNTKHFSVKILVLKIQNILVLKY